MKTLYKRRMLRLARFLDNLPEKKFNLQIIVDGTTKPPCKSDLQDETCGTVGCAFGWSPIVFPSLLVYRQGYYGYKDFDVVLRTNKKKKNFDAIQEVMNITRTEALDLFDSGSHQLYNARPRDVANKIRKFVKDKAKA